MPITQQSLQDCCLKIVYFAALEQMQPAPAPLQEAKATPLKE